MLSLGKVSERSPTARTLVRGVVLTGCMAASACLSDPPPVELSESGRWEVVSATRGGRPTSTLNAAYFEFDTATHLITTNLSGDEDVARYQRNGSELSAQGSNLFDQLQITSITDSTLRLETVVRGTPFQLDMVATAVVQ